MIILFYTIATFIITIDEAWNINHPRPNPRKNYHILRWETQDFYSQKIRGEWVLRKHRKTDDETKKIIRNNYWKERNDRSKRRN